MDEENHTMFCEKFNSLSAAQKDTVKGAFGNIDVTNTGAVQTWLEDNEGADFDGIMAKLNAI